MHDLVTVVVIFVVVELLRNLALLGGNKKRVVVPANRTVGETVMCLLFTLAIDGLTLWWVFTR